MLYCDFINGELCGIWIIINEIYHSNKKYFCFSTKNIYNKQNINLTHVYIKLFNHICNKCGKLFW